VDGIISHLTLKHGGSLHDKGIVTLTSKSILSDKPIGAVWNCVDFSSGYFLSKPQPGQWVCWDFHKRRIHPTHYTIASQELKSWVLECSADGVNWVEIDRKTNTDFFEAGIASFAVSRSAECRFIRLTQTGKNQEGYDILVLQLFEVFGTILE
jgi:hypothetical protein